MSIGNGYLASDKILTSTANQELVPPRKVGWTEGYKIRKLSFDNAEQACTIIINNETTAFLKIGQGFEMGYDDVPIHSFIIKEAGVKYSWVAIF